MWGACGPPPPFFRYLSYIKNAHKNCTKNTKTYMKSCEKYVIMYKDRNRPGAGVRSRRTARSTPSTRRSISSSTPSARRRWRRCAGAEPRNVSLLNGATSLRGSCGKVFCGDLAAKPHAAFCGNGQSRGSDPHGVLCKVVCPKDLLFLAVLFPHKTFA